MTWRQVKIALLVIGGALLVAYLTSFVVMAKTAELSSVRAAAATSLSCPPDRIEVGFGHDDNDIITHDVTGCGRTGRIDCIDRSADRLGVIGSYFGVDYECWFHAPLPTGGYGPIGRAVSE
jgi:hypothetical protein